MTSKQNAAYDNSALPGAHGSGLTEDSRETGRNHGLEMPGAGIGAMQPQAGYGGGARSGAGEVCDMPNVYNPSGPDAVKAVHHVQDDRRERTYEPTTVEETVVHHDVERVKPVLHEEVHQTRLHEVTHHKVAPVRDLGVTEVVHHRDTDECGHRVNTDMNAVRGTGTNMLDNIKDKITGHHTSNTNTNTMTGEARVPATVTTVTDTVTNSSDPDYRRMDGKDNFVHDDKVGGVKGLINKVVPGPGPFTK